MSSSEITCDQQKARCSCILPPEHQGDHECECGGRWDRDGVPTRMPYRYSGGPMDGMPFMPGVLFNMMEGLE